MKGDFSRVTFDRKAHFSSVLMQQGRVLLDADWNEQTAILLHYLQTLAADLIGPHGGPAGELGFAVSPTTQGTPPRIADLQIGAGRYYVDGLLCEVDSQTLYTAQPDWRGGEFGKDVTLPLLVYLDVWEKEVNSIEVPRIREVALGGPETALRSKVVWQVRFVQRADAAPLNLNVNNVKCRTFAFTNPWQTLVESLQPANRGRLAANAANAADDPTNPCIQSPEARYRGAENHLYRVEIHRGGPAGTATFKWSRDNGSVIFPIETINGPLLTLETLGRDATLGLETGNWVEIVDSETGFGSDPVALLQVHDVDPIAVSVTLSGTPAADPQKALYLRRWDHQEGDPTLGGLTILDGAAVVEAAASPKWLNLEDGIQIRFDTAGPYRAGDYWLIPARTETGDVDWPETNNVPDLLPPHGVEHHYAPLAVIFADGVAPPKTIDLRHTIIPIASCCPAVEVEHPAVVAPGTMIEFEAVVTPPIQSPVFNWTVDGGTIEPPGSQGILVRVRPNAGQQRVTATVIVRTLTGCVVSGRGTCVIAGP